jgi:hypothetical protein
MGGQIERRICDSLRSAGAGGMALVVDDFDVGEIIIGHFAFEIVVLKFGVRDVVGGTCNRRRGHDGEQTVAMELDTMVRWK